MNINEFKERMKREAVSFINESKGSIASEDDPLFVKLDFAKKIVEYTDSFICLPENECKLVEFDEKNVLEELYELYEENTCIFKLDTTDSFNNVINEIIDAIYYYYSGEHDRYISEYRKNSFTFMAQGYYGNRTMITIKKKNEDIDSLIKGSPLEGSDRKADRTIIRIPGTENLVLIYNKYMEQDCIEKSKNYETKIKPLAAIPEMGIVIYSTCIVCRQNEMGELESLQSHDTDRFIKYLAE